MQASAAETCKTCLFGRMHIPTTCVAQGGKLPSIDKSFDFSGFFVHDDGACWETFGRASRWYRDDFTCCCGLLLSALANLSSGRRRRSGRHKKHGKVVRVDCQPVRRLNGGCTLLIIGHALRLTDKSSEDIGLRLECWMEGKLSQYGVNLRAGEDAKRHDDEKLQKPGWEGVLLIAL